MSPVAWIVMLAFVLPIVSGFGYLLFDQSSVRIPPGRLGLLLIKGKPTAKVLLPGAHWVPALRKRLAVDYPALEQSYRAMEHSGPEPGQGEFTGPPLRATLGDRARVTVSYTVRFQIAPQGLPTVHTRFGPDGIWAIVRDTSSAAISDVLNDPSHGIDDLFGPARAALQVELSRAVAQALSEVGLQLTAFSLGEVDLGLSGEVIQATVRARLELEREQAEAATRMLRVRQDAELAPFISGASDAALRYRQTDVWRDLAARPDALTIAVPSPTGGVAKAEPDPGEPNPAAS